ncbi:membrane-associated progesterone-binding 4 [Olea europaea subsp. europaea]|uniref:Membrane-associated progesterone-binding 4 n=1 Tax=Olea europaea subsp. europaea TaxID=158383 RepID=A0A8S0Q6I3_OLEEU|nr:membrane-associated progesterone-binding 4 [Olea europaea subsp. europaea]
MRWSPFFWIPICLALLSFFLFRIFPFNSPHNQPQGKLFTAEELAPYNGTDPQLPILLGILGSVFDVTKGKSHYGAGGGYNHFAGRFVGKLVGRYYDIEGNPTKYLKGAEAKVARGAQLLEKQKIEEAQVPSCNSRWSQDEGSEVWCDDGYPRLVQRPVEIALTGKMSKRCACFKEDELGQSGLEVYDGCDYFATKCRL